MVRSATHRESMTPVAVKITSLVNLSRKQRKETYKIVRIRNHGHRCIIMVNHNNESNDNNSNEHNDTTSDNWSLQI